MAKDADKFFISVKDTSTPGKILPGRTLGKRRKKEDAFRDRAELAKRACLSAWQVGIFHHNKLVD